jgi:hypothetical protein
MGLMTSKRVGQIEQIEQIEQGAGQADSAADRLRASGSVRGKLRNVAQD